MFYSKKYNLLYIASPKTGTVTVHDILEKLAPDGKRREIITKEGRVIRSKDLRSRIMGHAPAREIKEALGEQYNELNTFAFIRHPYSKLVSSYFFNRKHSLLKRKEIKGIKSKIKTFLTILFAKIIPFKLWVFLYPYKSNIKYIMDYNGKRIVKYIGRTEHLDNDLSYILERLGFDTKSLTIKKLNASKHLNYEYYFKGKIFNFLVNLKFKRDLEIYQKISLELEKSA